MSCKLSKCDYPLCAFTQYLGKMTQLFCLRPLSPKFALRAFGPVLLGLVSSLSGLLNRAELLCLLLDVRPLAVCVCMFVCPCVCACVHVFAIGSALLLHGLVLWACFVVHHAGGRLLKSVAGLADTACFYDLFVLLCDEIAGA